MYKQGQVHHRPSHCQSSTTSGEPSSLPDGQTSFSSSSITAAAVVALPWASTIPRSSPPPLVVAASVLSPVGSVDTRQVGSPWSLPQPPLPTSSPTLGPNANRTTRTPLFRQRAPLGSDHTRSTTTTTATANTTVVTPGRRSHTAVSNSEQGSSTAANTNSHDNINMKARSLRSWRLPREVPLVSPAVAELVRRPRALIADTGRLDKVVASSSRPLLPSCSPHQRGRHTPSPFSTAAAASSEPPPPILFVKVDLPSDILKGLDGDDDGGRFEGEYERLVFTDDGARGGGSLLPDEYDDDHDDESEYNASDSSAMGIGGGAARAPQLTGSPSRQDHHHNGARMAAVPVGRPRDGMNGSFSPTTTTTMTAASASVELILGQRLGISAAALNLTLTGSHRHLAQAILLGGTAPSLAMAMTMTGRGGAGVADASGTPSAVSAPALFQQTTNTPGGDLFITHFPPQQQPWSHSQPQSLQGTLARDSVNFNDTIGTRDGGGASPGLQDSISGETHHNHNHNHNHNQQQHQHQQLYGRERCTESAPSPPPPAPVAAATAFFPAATGLEDLKATLRSFLDGAGTADTTATAAAGQGIDRGNTAQQQQPTDEQFYDATDSRRLLVPPPRATHAALARLYGSANGATAQSNTGSINRSSSGSTFLCAPQQQRQGPCIESGPPPNTAAAAAANNGDDREGAAFVFESLTVEAVARRFGRRDLLTIDEDWEDNGGGVVLATYSNGGGGGLVASPAALVLSAAAEAARRRALDVCTVCSICPSSLVESRDGGGSVARWENRGRSTALGSSSSSSKSPMTNGNSGGDASAVRRVAVAARKSKRRVKMTPAPTQQDSYYSHLHTPESIIRAHEAAAAAAAEALMAGTAGVTVVAGGGGGGSSDDTTIANHHNINEGASTAVQRAIAARESFLDAQARRRAPDEKLQNKVGQWHDRTRLVPVVVVSTSADLSHRRRRRSATGSDGDDIAHEVMAAAATTTSGGGCGGDVEALLAQLTDNTTRHLEKLRERAARKGGRRQRCLTPRYEEDPGAAHEAVMARAQEDEHDVSRSNAVARRRVDDRVGRNTIDMGNDNSGDGNIGGNGFHHYGGGGISWGGSGGGERESSSAGGGGDGAADGNFVLDADGGRIAYRQLASRFGPFGEKVKPRDASPAYDSEASVVVGGGGSVDIRGDSHAPARLRASLRRLMKPRTTTSDDGGGGGTLFKVSRHSTASTGSNAVAGRTGATGLFPTSGPSLLAIKDAAATTIAVAGSDGGSSTVAHPRAGIAARSSIVSSGVGAITCDAPLTPAEAGLLDLLFAVTRLGPGGSSTTTTSGTTATRQSQRALLSHRAVALVTVAPPADAADPAALIAAMYLDGGSSNDKSNSNGRYIATDMCTIHRAHTLIAAATTTEATDLDAPPPQSQAHSHSQPPALPLVLQFESVDVRCAAAAAPGKRPPLLLARDRWSIDRAAPATPVTVTAVPTDLMTLLTRLGPTALAALLGGDDAKSNSSSKGIRQNSQQQLPASLSHAPSAAAARASWREALCGLCCHPSGATPVATATATVVVSRLVSFSFDAAAALEQSVWRSVQLKRLSDQYLRASEATVIVTSSTAVTGAEPEPLATAAKRVAVATIADALPAATGDDSPITTDGPTTTAATNTVGAQRDSCVSFVVATKSPLARSTSRKRQDQDQQQHSGALKPGRGSDGGGGGGASAESSSTLLAMIGWRPAADAAVGLGINQRQRLHREAVGSALAGGGIEQRCHSPDDNSSNNGAQRDDAGSNAACGGDVSLLPLPAEGGGDGAPSSLLPLPPRGTTTTTSGGGSGAIALSTAELGPPLTFNGIPFAPTSAANGGSGGRSCYPLDMEHLYVTAALAAEEITAVLVPKLSSLREAYATAHTKAARHIDNSNAMGNNNASNIAAPPPPPPSAALVVALKGWWALTPLLEIESAYAACLAEVRSREQTILRFNDHVAAFNTHQDRQRRVWGPLYKSSLAVTYLMCMRLRASGLEGLPERYLPLLHQAVLFAGCLGGHRELRAQLKEVLVDLADRAKRVQVHVDALPDRLLEDVAAAIEAGQYQQHQQESVKSADDGAAAAADAAVAWSLSFPTVRGGGGGGCQAADIISCLTTEADVRGVPLTPVVLPAVRLFDIPALPSALHR